MGEKKEGRGWEGWAWWLTQVIPAKAEEILKLRKGARLSLTTESEKTLAKEPH